mgnify:CR=1 FL=1
MKIDSLLQILKSKGCDKLLIKKLSPNDNSKNQVYFGGEKALKYLPFKTSVLVEQKSKKKTARKYIFRNLLEFNWIVDNGCFVAPEAKLIFYPQYPESRLSGFLKGCKNAPSKIIGPRGKNRFLILSFNKNGQSFGYVDFINTDFNSFLNKNFDTEENDTFFESTISLIEAKKGKNSSIGNSTIEIRKAIKSVCDRGWIASSKLDAKGKKQSYSAPNGGGFTLEAELGIMPNSDANPDYLGWELKQHSGKPVTLFTPEPDAGFYKENGVAEFIRTFGYPDRSGKKNRFNFGGVHRVNDKDFHKLTKMKIVIHGYSNGTFTTNDGYIGLQTTNGEIVAKWSFIKLLIHWQRKHAKTCFIKSERKESNGQTFYRFSPVIELGIESTFTNFLDSMIKGASYYDPSSKLFKEGEKWKSKARNQFRVKEGDLQSLFNIYYRINIYS